MLFFGRERSGVVQARRWKARTGFRFGLSLILLFGMLIRPEWMFSPFVVDDDAVGEGSAVAVDDLATGRQDDDNRSGVGRQRDGVTRSGLLGEEPA